MKISSSSPPNEERYRQNLAREFKKMATLWDKDAGSISAGDLEALICESVPRCPARRSQMTSEHISTHRLSYALEPDQKDAFIKKHGDGFDFKIIESGPIDITVHPNGSFSGGARYIQYSYDAAAEIILNIEKTYQAHHIFAKRDGKVDENEFMYFFQNYAKLKTALV